QPRMHQIGSFAACHEVQTVAVTTAEKYERFLAVLQHRVREARPDVINVIGVVRSRLSSGRSGGEEHRAQSEIYEIHRMRMSHHYRFLPRRPNSVPKNSETQPAADKLR